MLFDTFDLDYGPMTLLLKLDRDTVVTYSTYMLKMKSAPKIVQNISFRDIEKFMLSWLYCLVMISINLSETAYFVHWKSETMFETNYFLTIFFSNKNFFLNFFLRLNFVLDWILSQTEFVLDFVSDYIPQLYFVCNHLIQCM